MSELKTEEGRIETENSYGQVWNTKEMQEDFTVLGFSYGFCVVVRKSDQQRGTLDFQHAPRFYHSFKEDN